MDNEDFKVEVVLPHGWMAEINNINSYTNTELLTRKEIIEKYGYLLTDYQLNFLKNEK